MRLWGVPEYRLGLDAGKAEAWVERIRAERRATPP
jgi:hypothetical protein